MGTHDTRQIRRRLACGVIVGIALILPATGLPQALPTLARVLPLPAPGDLPPHHALHPHLKLLTKYEEAHRRDQAGALARSVRSTKDISSLRERLLWALRDKPGRSDAAALRRTSIAYFWVRDIEGIGVEGELGASFCQSFHLAAKSLEGEDFREHLGRLASFLRAALLRLMTPPASASARPPTADQMPPGASSRPPQGDPLPPTRLAVLVFGLTALFASLLTALLAAAWRRGRRGGVEVLVDAAGVAALEAGDAETALRLLEGAVKRAGSAAHRVRCHHMRCLVRLGRLEQAAELWTQVGMEGVPLALLYTLARELEDAGARGLAREAYARLVVVSPHFGDVEARFRWLEVEREKELGGPGVKSIVDRLPSYFKQPRLVGRGGMGLVLQAHDERTGRSVALKVVAPLLEEDRRVRARFAREIRTLFALDHPYIVRILDVGSDPIPYYAMELVEGRTLRDLLGRREPALSRTLALLAGVAEALSYAHSRGVVHRDLKPENVLVDLHDRPRVVDFGLAQIQKATRITSTGEVLGTLSYMSPEQIEAKGVAAATDVYALGLIIHEAATGRLPWPPESFAVRLVEPAPPLPPDLPRRNDLQQLVSSCLERQEAQRPCAVLVAERLHELARCIAPA